MQPPSDRLVPDLVTTKRTVNVSDDAGGNVPTLTTIATGVRCSIAPARAARVIDMASVGVRVSHLIHFIADPGLITDDVIVPEDTDIWGTLSLKVISRPVRTGSADSVWKCDCVDVT